MASPRTISDEFNEENYYSRPVRAANEGGSIKRDSTRNVVLENRTSEALVVKNPRQKIAANDPRHEPTHETFNKEYSKKGLQPLGIIGKDKPTDQLIEDEDYESGNQVENRPSLKNNNRKSRLAKKLLSSRVIEDALLKKKAQSISRVILSVETSLWLFLKAPLAVVGAVFFGFAGTYYYLIDAAGFLGDIVEGVRSGINFIISQLGVGDDLLNPTAPLMLVWCLIFAITIIEFLAIYLVYKLFGINAVFGEEGSGLKMGGLLIFFIGSLIPIVNFVPWIIPWLIAVSLNPK